MGNICSPGDKETSKSTAFQAASESDSFSAQQQNALSSIQDSNPQLDNKPLGSNADVTDTADAERIKKLQAEQARLDMIVGNAGRRMVSVRSTRGATTYYDKGFAAAFASHLEKTTQFSEELEVRLPPPSSGGVYARLSQPHWDGIVLGDKGGLAGCAGESPVKRMDRIAESLLESSVPGKQQLFAGASPMIENL